ncbi:MAG: metallophosphoesterase family protein [Polyangiaceae bacterium]
MASVAVLLSACSSYTAGEAQSPGSGSDDGGACTPTCAGQCGGPDGCGGTCASTCPTGNSCLPPVFKVCGTCAPSCDGKCGGPDGCGGTCDLTCTNGDGCLPPSYTTCGACTRSCAGKCGGDDGCGSTCAPTCASGQTCTAPDYTQCLNTGPIGVHGGTVDLLHFGITGDTRPPNSGTLTSSNPYPTMVLNTIVDQMNAHGVQFGLDLGDHMYSNSRTNLPLATQEMNLYLSSVSRLGKTWFMTQGNHECYGGGCYAGSSNGDFVAFMNALAPISSTPYYTFDVTTSLGIATFVIVADMSYDSTEASWLDATLTAADAKAKYTIVARHHPEGDSSVSTNKTEMAVIRRHKFSLFLSGHNHLYNHMTVDNGRDIILGTGGAPLIAGGAFFGYALIDQQTSGRLTVTVYDINSATPVDTWSVGPN